MVFKFGKYAVPLFLVGYFLYKQYPQTTIQDFAIKSKSHEPLSIHKTLIQKQETTHKQETRIAAPIERTDQKFHLKFQKLLKLESKVLLSEEEKELTQTILEDKNFVLNLFEKLNHREVLKFNSQEESARIDVISILQTAQSLNINTSLILEESFKIITDFNNFELLDKHLRGSLVGDKIELLLMLYTSVPESVVLLTQEFLESGEPLKKYIAQSTINLKKLERNF
jgi:hypothetical protein